MQTLPSERRLPVQGDWYPLNTNSLAFSHQSSTTGLMIIYQHLARSWPWIRSWPSFYWTSIWTRPKKEWEWMIELFTICTYYIRQRRTNDLYTMKRQPPSYWTLRPLKDCFGRFYLVRGSLCYWPGCNIWCRRKGKGWSTGIGVSQKRRVPLRIPPTDYCSHTHRPYPSPELS